MTLVITDVSIWGIVMGADSALAITRQGQTTVLTDAQKLRPIDHLRAGISFWGLGRIGGRYTWQWLDDVIDSSNHISTLKEFADLLCRELHANLGVASELMGIHLAGFVEVDDQLCPQVFHIHNAHEKYPYDQSPVQFHVEDSLPPNKWLELVDKLRGSPRVPTFELRNGDWYFYVQWFMAMEKLLEENFRLRGIQVPIGNLTGVQEFVRFKIKTIADLYRMSDSLKFVSEPIATLEMSPIPVYSRYSIR